MVKKSSLEEALKSCWDKKTSSDPENWTEKNPAWGQCAVTSLVINDYLGGDIVWAEAVLPKGEKISHYFNKIKGVEKDFTKIQFPKATKIPKGRQKTKGYNSTREYILSYSKTQKRYEILKNRVSEYLDNLSLKNH